MLFTWLRRYADFNGRSSRKEYWLGVLGMVILVVAAHIVDRALFGGFLWEDGGPASLLVALGIVIPSLALQIRRLHDTDRTGWWVLINLIPFVGCLVLLVFSLIPGDPRANRFGPPPPETPGLDAPSASPPPAAEAPPAA